MGALWGLASGLADFSFLDFDNITISNSTNAKIKINKWKAEKRDEVVKWLAYH